MFLDYKSNDNLLHYYPSLRLNVDPHDSLVQQLVSEAWLRLDRYDLTALLLLLLLCFFVCFFVLNL